MINNTERGYYTAEYQKWIEERIDEGIREAKRNAEEFFNREVVIVFEPANG